MHNINIRELFRACQQLGRKIICEYSFSFSKSQFLYLVDSITEVRSVGQLKTTFYAAAAAAATSTDALRCL